MKDDIQVRLGGYVHTSSYPPIKVVAKNEEYAELLLDCFSGNDSEMTAVCQYSYHARNNKPYDDEIAACIEKIANVEMLHLQILSDLIFMLGGYPVYRSSNKADTGYWSGRHVCYGRSLLEQLQSDLELEYRQIKGYHTLIYLIEDPFIQAILQRMILDEQVHVVLFKKLMKQYSE